MSILCCVSWLWCALSSFRGVLDYLFCGIARARWCSWLPEYVNARWESLRLASCAFMYEGCLLEGAARVLSTKSTRMDFRFENSLSVLVRLLRAILWLVPVASEELVEYWIPCCFVFVFHECNCLLFILNLRCESSSWGTVPLPCGFVRSLFQLVFYGQSRLE